MWLLQELSLLFYRLMTAEMSFRGSLCLTFRYHIHGSDTGHLTVLVKRGEDTSVVFLEGLYDYDSWQTARVMLASNGSFQVNILMLASNGSFQVNILVHKQYRIIKLQVELFDP